MFQEFIQNASLSGVDFAKYIETLKISGELQSFLPEIAIMDKYEQTPIHHPEGNVYQHTIAALRQQLNTNKAIVNLAILFHDVGKPSTYLFQKDKHTFYGHELRGVPIVNNICERFGLHKKASDIIKYCCENHMRCHLILEMKDSKVKSLVTHEYFDYLLQVVECDSKCRLQAFNSQEWDLIIAKINKFKS